MVVYKVSRQPWLGYGVITIASLVFGGGAGEIVEDNVTGLKTIIYDRDDLLEKIKILTDEKLNSEMTRNAYLRLEQIEKEIVKQ